MNIVIINQPVGNRGDESAHRALVRQLSIDYPNDNISVIFFGETLESTIPIQVEASNLQYINVFFNRGKIRIARLAIKYHIVGLVVNLLPAYRKVNRHIKNADKVVCAPGGICLGRFMNWDHLFWLNCVLLNNKPLAYFSRSFGPFDTGSKYRDIFKQESFKVLRSMSFISIRDEKTMEIADNIGLSYVPSIDSAFLEQPKVDVSFLESVLSNDYVVFVPNSLVWQPAFSQADKNAINKFYLAIIELINKRFSKTKIIMMPQLYAQKEKNDFSFFQSLKMLSKSDNIVVLEDTYSSDIQQNIIRGSKLVIGARYHSIVFAINNERPFVSLSYEHKMFGLLSILGLSDKQVDITKIGTKDFSHAIALHKVDEILEKNTDMVPYHNKAQSIISNCYSQLLKWLNEG